MSVSVLFGEVEHEFVRVDVLTRAHPGGLGLFDGNWLNAQLDLSTERRRWRAPALLRADDFARLSRELGEVLAGARDEARFRPRDPWLVFGIQRDDSGFQAEVGARDGHFPGADSFTWHLGRERLQALAGSVAAVVAAFEVR